MPEIVGISLHGQPVDSGHCPGFFKDLLRYKILPDIIGIHNGGYKAVGYVPIISPELPGILGEAVSSVPKGRVVVVVPDSGIQANPVNDVPGV